MVLLLVPCCRPMAEFYDTKRQTATLFAKAVCDAGWTLDSSAAQAAAASHVLCLAPASPVRVHACMWLFAASLASAGREAAGHRGTSAGSSSPFDSQACLEAGRQLRACVVVQALGQPDGATLSDKLMLRASWCAACACVAPVKRDTHCYEPGIHVQNCLNVCPRMLKQ